MLLFDRSIFHSTSWFILYYLLFCLLLFVVNIGLFFVRIGNGVKYIAQGLEKNTSLIRLDLCHTDIGCSGKFSCMTIVVYTCLKRLYCVVGAIALGAALCDNKTLRHLDIEHCSIGHKGGASLAMMLSVNNGLCRLIVKSFVHFFQHYFFFLKKMFIVESKSSGRCCWISNCKCSWTRV
jgi:hypothetical protein